MADTSSPAIEGSIEDQRPEVITKLVSIAGREVLCRFLTEAQFMQMAYETGIMANESIPTARKVKTLERMFRILRSLIVHDDDKDYMEDLVAEGVVTMFDLMKVIQELSEADAGKTAPKVRRGNVTQGRRR